MRAIPSHPMALLSFLLTTLVAFGTTAPAVATEAQSAMTSTAQETTLLAQVEAAEEDFNRAARERDRDSFRNLLSKDSLFLAGELQQGRLAVLAVWQHLFDGKYDFRYEAELIEASVAASGDMAWAVGSVRTSFQRPGLPTPEVLDSHYLHIWTPEEGSWKLSHAASLVVHPTLGSARDPRSGLMTAWPELADQIDSNIALRWTPEEKIRAASGEMAFTFGRYEASFTPDSPETEEQPSEDTQEGAVSGGGHFLAVWQKDAQGHWQLAAEGFTPPEIYGGD